MEYIEKADYTGKRHLRGTANDATACGKTITDAVTGICIAPMFDCQRCRGTLRSAGYQI